MSLLWKPRYRIPGGPTDPSAWDSFYDDATDHYDRVVYRKPAEEQGEREEETE